MKVQAVCVDFWGTLTLDSPASDERCRGARLAGMRHVLAAQDIDIALPRLLQAYQESATHLHRAWIERKDLGVVDHVHTILRAVDPSLAERITADTLTALVDAYARPLLLVMPAADPGARAALAHLRNAGIALAIVSNTMRTPGVVLRQVLARLGLLEYFSHAVFSDELGIRKPDAAIFMAALRALAVEPAAAVHVGDDPVLDVLGARAAGLRVVQVVAGRRGSILDAERPDRTIAHLEELPAAIATLETA